MKLISTLCFLLFFCVSFSQEVDSRLLDRFSRTELIELQNSDPNEYALITYALDNAIYFSNGTNPKSVGLKVIQRPSPNATYIDLGLTILDQNQYFKIEGEESILVVKSKWVLNHEMGKALNDEK